MVRELQEVIGALEADDNVRAVVFDSAVDYFQITTLVRAVLR